MIRGRPGTSRRPALCSAIAIGGRVGLSRARRSSFSMPDRRVTIQIVAGVTACLRCAARRAGRDSAAGPAACARDATTGTLAKVDSLSSELWRAAK